jgi:glycosyltransferase involved in cell wall biosynthesis
MIQVLFVGPVSGYVSYNVVSKGLLRALTMAGIRPLIADTSWDGSPNHTDGYFDHKAVQWLDRRDVLHLVQKGEALGDGPKICVAVNPTHHLMEIANKGIQVAGLHVGDVDVIPPAWRELMNREAVVLCPSSWMRQVVQNSGVTTPTLVVHHGVGPLFAPSLETPDTDELPVVLLHLCASTFYPERKSTPQVLEAFKQIVDDGEAVVLRLVFGMKTKQVKHLLQLIPQDIRTRFQVHFQEGSRPQDEISDAYKSVHALLAPSRAEGFGMCPLEARACGVPVIQTMCTGHADHVDGDPAEWGIVPVAHGDMEPAWGDYGRAPEVTTESIYLAIKAFLALRKEATEAARRRAESVRFNWSWEKVSEPLVQWIKDRS